VEAALVLPPELHQPSLARPLDLLAKYPPLVWICPRYESFSPLLGASVPRPQVSA